MINGSGESFTDHENANFIFNNTFFFFENCTDYEVMWEKIWSSRTVHSWQYNMAHAHFILHYGGCRHTLRMCLLYCMFFNSNKCALTSHLYKDCSAYQMLFRILMMWKKIHNKQQSNCYAALWPTDNITLRPYVSTYFISSAFLPPVSPQSVYNATCADSLWRYRICPLCQLFNPAG